MARHSNTQVSVEGDRGRPPHRHPRGGRVPQTDMCLTCLEALIENVDDGVIVCDPSGGVERMNSRATGIHGYACIDQAWHSLHEFEETFDLYAPDGEAIPPADWPLSRVLRGEPFRDLRILMRSRRTGAQCALRCDGAPVRDAQGNVVLAVLTLHRPEDQAATALRESESRLRSIFRAAPVGIGLVVNRVLLDVNDRLCEMVGYRREELLGRSARLLYPTEEDYNYVGREKYRQITELGTGAVETRWQKKDGDIIDVLLSSTPLDLNDLPKGVTFTALDITARRKMEAELTDIFNLSLDMVCIADLRTGFFTRVNPAFERTLGYSEAELLSRPFLDLVHPDDVEATATLLRDILGRGEQVFSFENRCRCKDGSYRWVNWTSHPRVEQGRTYAIGRDITERKQAEEALRFTQFAIDHTADAAFWMTEDGDFFYVNEAACRALGYSRDELLRMSVYDIDPAFTPRLWDESWVRLKAQKETVIETVHRARDGRVYPVEIRANYLAFGGREYDCAFARDITERKQAEETLKRQQQQLRESERRLRTLMGNLPGMAYRCLNAPDWPFEFVSEGSLALTGYEPREITLGGNIAYGDLIHPDDRQMVWDRVQNAVRRDAPFDLEYRIRTKDGAERWVFERGRAVPSEAAGAMPLEGFIADITKRKRAEESLCKVNERLELQVAERTEELTHTVARLQQLTLELSQAEDRERKRIADILHDDVQQILAAARFHLNLLCLDAESFEESRDVIEKVRQMLKDAIEKARNLSHEISPVLYQVDLPEMMNWLARHMQHTHGLTVHVEAHGRVDSSSEPLKALLHRVAQELLFNVAKHADVKEATIRLRRAGRCLFLSVIDRGRGFDPQELTQTPGFGLLSIRERIGLLGGRMKIKSARGSGARILILVPDEPGRADTD